MAIIKDILAISRRELHAWVRRPLLLFVMVVAPLLCMWLFLSMMEKGLPTNLPAGLVDADDTTVTRQLTRILDAMEGTEITQRYATFGEARDAMEQGEIYGFFYIPDGLTEKAIANCQPEVAFYTNDAFFVPGSLLMKDMRLTSELGSLALTRENLYAHGMTTQQAMAIIQAIVVETHPLGNACLSYSVYLNNVLLPGILLLIAMLSAAYTLGIEWKLGTQQRIYAMARRRAWVVIMGKLLPQTVLFTVLFAVYDVCLYRLMGFPCRCGIWFMLCLGFVSVLAAQSVAVFFSALFVGQMRMGMSACALWGIVSFSISGFTYPVQAMDWPLQVLAWLFPLREYFLIYVNSALNGYALHYAWPAVVGLLAFLALPFTLLWRYPYAFKSVNYKP